MQGEATIHKTKPARIVWLWGAVPLLLLAVIIYMLSSLGTGIKDEPVAPIEALNVEKIALTEQGFKVKVLNSGPEEVTIAQVIVNDAFWNANFHPSSTIGRLGQTEISIPYGWVEGDPYSIKLITTNGLIFTA